MRNPGGEVQWAFECNAHDPDAGNEIFVGDARLPEVQAALRDAGILSHFVQGGALYCPAANVLIRRADNTAGEFQVGVGGVGLRTSCPTETKP